MNQDLALRVLGQIMDWSDEDARKEFQWLRLIGRLKYDEYEDFRAGMRFIESLAKWLQQFDKDERKTAYTFVREALVYIGPSEMQRLVEQFYPRVVHDRLIRSVASECSIPTYRVLADGKARKSLERLRRQTLFMGLSDGARIDTIRHANAGRLSNEQLVGNTQVDFDKWKDLLENLRDDQKAQRACFRIVYLIDDFSGSGSTFLRPDGGKNWKGKIVRFRESVSTATKVIGTFLESDWELCVHHYVASHNAAKNIKERLKKADGFLRKSGDWAKTTYTSFGTILPCDLPINAVGGRHTDFIKLAYKYYDPAIETKHTGVGGTSNIALGYGECALPLILHQNTPNNSVALLWAETEGSNRDGGVVPAMRPLFRRRQRHV